MSHKTLRSPHDFPTVLPAARLGRPRIRALAFAVGLLVFTPITSVALELGEAAIRSGLGQPLRVEIPYRLAADERLVPTCINLVPPARLDDALPTYSRLSRIAITPTHIEIFGDSRVLEPLIALTVDVHCQATPRFLRSFQLFVDPPVLEPAIRSNGIQVADARAGAAVDFSTPVPNNVPITTSELRTRSTTTSATSGATASTQATSTPRTPSSARARGQTGGSLTQGQTYLVVRGDTLSGIAARIGDRQATIQEAAEAIFATNPEAFSRGDRDLIQAGHSITIPILTPAAAPPPVQTSEAVPERAEPAPPVAVPEIVEAPAAAVPVAIPEIETSPAAVPVEQPSAAALLPTAVAFEGASPVTTGRTSIWWTALLALGVAIVLSTSLLFVLRRRKQEAAPQDSPTLRSSPPRRLVDPVAGFVVIEGQSPTSTVKMPAPQGPEKAPAGPGPLALTIGPNDPVDLDVGVPAAGDEPVDWLGDRAAAAAVANPTIVDSTIESAATVQFPSPANAAPVQHQQLAPHVDISGPTIDDEQHTLTIVELDILRQDYEAEHTLTQESNKALRDAVADLKATQAALAASADTATLEMPKRPEPQTEETQPVPKRRSSN